MEATSIQMVGAILFGLAVMHTFLVKRFEHLAHKYPLGSPKGNLFHYLGEVEVVFGFWAGLFVIYHYWQGFIHHIHDGFGAATGHAAHETVAFLESLNFTEPAFVFVIMAMAGTRPIIKASER
jgi:hypothetical protein